MKRREGETREDYKKRLKREKLVLKRYLRGHVFWRSSVLGTYRRHSEKGER